MKQFEGVMSSDGPTVTGEVSTFLGDSFTQTHLRSSNVVAVIQSISTLVGLVFNVVIISTYQLSPRLRTPQNVFVVNLAIADFLVLLTSIPAIYSILSEEDGNVYGGYGCDIFAWFVVEVCASSMWFIGAIGVTRYICICHPNLKSKIFTWPKCTIVATLIWIFNTGVVLPGLGWGRFGYREKIHICAIDFTYNLLYNVFSLIATYGLVVILILYSYIRIFLVFRASKRKVTGGNPVNKIHKSEYRLAIQLLVIFVIYNICWGPILNLNLWIDPMGEADLAIYEFCLFAMYFNSMINFPFYMYFNIAFRKEVCRIWLRRGNKEKSTSSNVVNSGQGTRSTRVGATSTDEFRQSAG